VNIEKNIALTAAAYDKFEKLRFSKNFIQAKDAFYKFTAQSMRSIADAEELATKFENNPEDPYGSAALRHLANLKAQLGKRLHQDAALSELITKLPVEAEGIVRMWGDTNLRINYKVEERDIKDNAIRETYARASRLKDDIWSLFPTQSFSDPKEVRKDPLLNEFRKQSQIDRTESLKALYSEVGFPDAIEKTVLDLLRIAFPSVVLQEFLTGTKLNTPYVYVDRNKLSENETEKRVKEISKKENLGILPAPWLASALFAAQIAASKQPDGNSRAVLWSKLVEAIPEANQNNPYDKQLKTLKMISKNNIAISQFAPRKDYELTEFETKEANDVLTRAIISRNAARLLQSDYEKATALTVTTLDYISLVKKLSHYTEFRDDLRTKHNRMVKSIADELVKLPQVSTADLKILWDYVKSVQFTPGEE